MPWMTATNPAQRQPATLERSMTLQSFNRERRTAWIETTTAAKHRTNGVLIDPDNCDQGQTQDSQ
jgi:hypothetical protein